MSRSWCKAAMTLILSVASLACFLGCSNSAPPEPSPLSAANVNLVFVVSEDLNDHAFGDVNQSTANLTSQGLQRSLAMATYLRQSVLGGNNVNGIYALEPMTHLQTAHGYPDMNALVAIQQFALLNQITLSSDPAGGNPYTGQNYPINVSYASGAVPSGVAVPSQFYPDCQGLDFNDTNGNNEALIGGIIAANAPGYYVFSAPWQTVSSTLAKLNALHGFNLAVPTQYAGPNSIYAISIPPAGSPALVTFNSNVMPAVTYPTLPASALVSAACTTPTPATITVTAGAGGAVIPAGINRNQTVYIVRHAEAHPHGYWSDNNYVGAGQWRALDLPNALLGKVDADQVWSLDPSQSSVGTVSSSGISQWSGVAPALTVQPFAIANDLPYNLLSSIMSSASNSPQLTSTFFFTGGTFSNHKLLLGWTYTQAPQLVNALISSYFPNGGAPTAPAWSPYDYDSLWVITIDAIGNLTADFTQCEGINSATLPVSPPLF
ncbi:hypothetical protein GMSM_29190 [Geomonas sp. Red276]